MTAPKPPDQKTLVGLPNELRAILERPRTAPPPLPAAQRTAAQAATAAPEPQPQPKAAMDRTLVGIPSEMQAALERALADQAAGVARPVRARPAPRPQPIASEQAELPPTASSSVLRVQAVRTIGVSSPAAESQSEPQKPSAKAAVAPAQRGTAARRSAPPPQQLPPRPVPRSTPPQQLPPRPASRSAPPNLPNPLPTQQVQAPRPAPARQPQLTSQAELLAQSQITSQPFLAPNAPLDWPPAQRRSEPAIALLLNTMDRGPSGASMPPATPQRAGASSTSRNPRSQPIAAEPSVIVAPHEPEQPAPQRAAVPDLDERAEHHDGPAQHHGQYEQHAPSAQHAHGTLDALAKAPSKRRGLGLASNTKTRRTKAVVDAPPKRWPAIALIALAVLAFACVILLRAPSLLPAPLAAMVAPAAPMHGAGDSREPAESAARMTSATAVAPVAAQPVATDSSAATDPGFAPPSPTRPPASPPFTSGLSAQLEKKAIERLLANDLAAAKPLYERLRAAEPTRPEFGVMVEILSRTCSQPPCSGVAP